MNDDGAEEVTIDNKGSIHIGYKLVGSFTILMLAAIVGGEPVLAKIGLSPNANKLDQVIENTMNLDAITEELHHHTALPWHKEAGELHEKTQASIEQLTATVGAMTQSIHAQTANMETLEEMVSRQMAQHDKLIDRLLDLPKNGE